jgi:hypothetical protein
MAVRAQHNFALQYIQSTPHPVGRQDEYSIDVGIFQASNSRKKARLTNTVAAC